MNEMTTEEIHEKDSYPSSSVEVNLEKICSPVADILTGIDSTDIQFVVVKIINIISCL